MPKSKIYPLLIFIIAFIQFSNTLQHQFAWDDKIVIEENPRVQKGVSAIPDLFVKYNSKYRNDKYGYRPIVLTSFATEISIGGKKNPAIHHFMNVVYYALLCLLIFYFLRLLFHLYDPLFAFLCALLFIVHPLHTEVVANIKSRDEIFSMLFSTGALLFFLRYLDTRKWWYIPFIIILYMLAFLSKENSILVLGLFPVIGWMRNGLNLKKDWAYLVILPVLGIISYFIQKASASSTAGVELTEGLGVYEENNILGNSLLYVYGFWNKLANALHILLKYLKLFVIPYPLVFFYGYNMVPVVTWSSPLVWLSLLIHIGLFSAGIYKRKDRPEILFGFLFYIITILLYTHIFRPLNDTMADRFLFTPSLGLVLCFTGILGWVFKTNWKKGKTVLNFSGFAKKNVPVTVIILAASVIFSGLTFSRNKVWKNDDTLVRSDIKNLENCSRAHFYYATQLHKQILMNPTRQAALEPEMLLHYRRSIEISDSAYYAYMELGTYYCNLYRYDEGIAIFEKAVKIFPNAADPAFFLGQAYTHKEEYAKAIPYLEKSLKLSPKQWGSYFFLSICYGKVGRSEEGLAMAYDGLAKFPGNGKEFYDALGHIYYDMGDMDKSTEATLKMLDNGAPPRDVYGRIVGRYMAKGDKENAGKWMEEGKKYGVVFQ